MSNDDYIDYRMEELDWVINRGQIDKFLIPLIKLLNEKEFFTNFCCSGLHKDHIRSKKLKPLKRPREESHSGYIAFDKYLSFEKESELEEISYSCNLVFEEYDRDKIRSIYDFEKKEHFLIAEESTSLNSCSIRNGFPEIINCNDKRKMTKKFLDGLVEHKWNLLYNEIEKIK